METLGKTSVVVEKVAEVKPVMSGCNVEIEEDLDAGGIRVHAIVPPTDLSGIEAEIQAIKDCITELKSIPAPVIVDYSEALNKLESNQRAMYLHIQLLEKRIAEVDAKPAEEVRTRIIERPGMTVHSIKTEFKLPLYVAVILGVVMISQVLQWLVMR